MPKKPPPTQAPQRAVLHVTGDLLFRLQDYHRASGVPGTISETATELLHAALDAPQTASALVLATRRRGYKQVRNDTIRRFQQMLGQIAREFETALGTFDDAQLDHYFESRQTREEA